MAANLGKLATALVEIKGDQAKFVKDLNSTKTLMNGFDQQAVAMTRNIGMAFAGMGVAVGAGLAVTVKPFADFEQVMTNVAAVSNSTQEEYKELSEFAKEMGETTVFSARESGLAMYYLASAGYSAQQQMESTAAVMELAAATQGDLSESAQLVVTSLKAFNLPATEAKRVVNLFAAGISSSQLKMESLGIAMPYVASVFNQLGYSIEATTAALGVLIDRGQPASMAGTRLATTMRKLLDPTKKVHEG